MGVSFLKEKVLYFTLTLKSERGLVESNEEIVKFLTSESIVSFVNSPLTPDTVVNGISPILFVTLLYDTVFSSLVFSVNLMEGRTTSVCTI